jgi:N-acetylglucosamine-6-phosphate deacetylase
MKDVARHAVAADTVFDGTTLHRDHAIVIEAGTIAAMMPRRDLPRGLPLQELPDGVWLAPGFIDVQVNGGGDVLFNDTPTVEGIAAIVAAHRRFGTTALLPTLISDTAEKMQAAAAAVEAAIVPMPGVLGIHFEGPFLSPERAGVHDPAMIRPPTPQDLEFLAAPHRGVRLVTLAAERVPAGFVRTLAAAGIRVALGHSMATYKETRAALEEGLTGFTHLFNAMRPLASREPGPIAAALETPGAFYGVIVDGEHVAPPMLRLALRGLGQPMLVSDAMPPVGGTRADFTLGGKRITAHDGRLTTEDGTLAGAALDMVSAVRNCVTLLDLPLADALHLASAAPAAFLGVGDRLGQIRPGYRADMVALDPAEIRVLASWVAGEESRPG